MSGGACPRTPLQLCRHYGLPLIKILATPLYVYKYSKSELNITFTQKNELVKFTQLLSEAKVGAYSRMSKVYSSFGVVITQLTFYSKKSVILLKSLSRNILTHVKCKLHTEC